jgi:hypothetical protein
VATADGEQELLARVEPGDERGRPRDHLVLPELLDDLRDALRG